MDVNGLISFGMDNAKPASPAKAPVVICFRTGGDTTNLHRWIFYLFVEIVFSIERVIKDDTLFWLGMIDELSQ